MLDDNLFSISGNEKFEIVLIVSNDGSHFDESEHFLQQHS